MLGKVLGHPTHHPRKEPTCDWRACCLYQWNPGVWPYAAACVLDKGHDGNHRVVGKTDQQLAQAVIERAGVVGLSRLNAKAVVGFGPDLVAVLTLNLPRSTGNRVNG